MMKENHHPHLEADNVHVIRSARFGGMVLPNLFLIRAKSSHILLVQTGEDDLQVKSQSLWEPTEHPIRKRVPVNATENWGGKFYYFFRWNM